MTDMSTEVRELWVSCQHGPSPGLQILEPIPTTISPILSQELQQPS